LFLLAHENGPGRSRGRFLSGNALALVGGFARVLLEPG
jgi:hypothetical protein